MAEAVDDDAAYRASMRSIFASGDGGDADEDDHQDISAHAWKCGDLEITYHLAFLAPGHGDALWNSSACLAEHLLSDSKRETLFGPKAHGRMPWPPRRALEFGAGAALPSLALLREGADRVIMTDRKEGSNESAFDALALSVRKNCEAWRINEEETGRRAAVLPHTWGENVCELTEEAGGTIDLLVASDCIYNPAYHEALLQSATASICRRSGVFVVGYSLHGNVPPGRVTDFFDRARSDAFGFEVVSEFCREYREGQGGIGSKDPDRGTVYVKVLAHRDSQYCR